MKVLIDNRWQGKTGIGRLSNEILKRKPDSVNVEYIKSAIGLGNPMTPFALWSEIRKNDATAFYSPSFFPPIPNRIPFVFTIHDLLHLYYHSRFHRFYLKSIIANLGKHSKKIITVSHFSRQEIIKHLGIPSDLIEVVYNGLDETFLQNEEAFDIGRPYFVYIGNRRVHKNLDRMITAFSYANISKEIVLAISGDSDDHLNCLIKELNIANRVYFLGSIPESTLPKVYKGAMGTLFVSLMEGFGLPILESMGSGTPVITSTTSSLSEISGGAAITLDPFDISSIAKAIESLVHDSELRCELIEKGVERSKMFSWNETARKTWEIITY